MATREERLMSAPSWGLDPQGVCGAPVNQGAGNNEAGSTGEIDPIECLAGDVNIVNLDIGKALSDSVAIVSRAPARAVVIFFAIFVLTTAAALGFSDARLPFGIASAIALFAMLTIGLIAGFENDSAIASAQGPVSGSDQRELERRFNMNLIHLNGDTQRKWSEGKFADAETAKTLTGNVLDAVIASKAGRLQNLGLKSASIVIVRRDGDDYLVRRIGGPLKACLSRGDRCHASSDLKEALRRYAPHSYYEWVSCCGRDLAIAVTADAPIEGTLKDEVERFMLFYQTQYERLRLFAMTPAPSHGSLPSA
jgi:hypothetical protein